LLTTERIELLLSQEGKDSGDGKQNTADMTQFVQTLLQQMKLNCVGGESHVVSGGGWWYSGSGSSNALCESNMLRTNALDEMGERISELEQSINDLRAEMGAEGTPPPAAPPKNTDDE
ncbi:hypothetical protein R6Q57_004336, partial [Mikania cordata]